MSSADEKKIRGKKRGRKTLLQDHEAELIQMVAEGLRPKVIAETLCSRHSFPAKTITAKQVSDWISYRKSNKQIKTEPVTGPKIAADWEDSCVLYSVFKIE